MKLHPLQQYLPKGDVLQVAEQTLMTVVNQARRRSWSAPYLFWAHQG